MDVISIAQGLVYAFIVVAFMLFISYYLHGSDHISNKDTSKILNRKNIIIMIASFSMLGVAITHFMSVETGNGYFSLENFAIFASGLLGGPFVGIPVGTIVGLEGILINDPMVMPYVFSDILSGFMGGLLWWMAGKSYPKILACTIFMLISQIVIMIIIGIFNSDTGLEFITHEGLAYMCFNVFATLLFSIMYLSAVRHKPIE